MVPRPLRGQLSKPPGACAVLRCSAGWLLAEVTLFQSHPSALAIRWSAPRHLKAGVLLCDQILTGVWKSPPGCLVPSTSFPTGHSLSRCLGRPQEAETFSRTPSFLPHPFPSTSSFPQVEKNFPVSRGNPILPKPPYSTRDAFPKHFVSS